MAIDISEFTATQKEDEVRQLEKRISAATSQLERLNNQILDLSDEIDKTAYKRRTMFREKHKPKFEKLDTRAALLGGAVRWPVKLYDVLYFLEIPKGGISSEVMKFTQHPVVTEGDDVRDFAPIMPYEDILLRMLTGVQAPGAHERTLSGRPIVDRLRFIRELPEVLLNSLANQGLILQNYLDICLELDLGN